jgi:hypothetical protein
MARIESVKTIGPGFTQLHTAVGKRFSVQIIEPLDAVEMRRVVNAINTQNLGRTDFAVIEKPGLALPWGAISASPIRLGTLDVRFVVLSGVDFTGSPGPVPS